NRRSAACRKLIWSQNVCGAYKSDGLAVEPIISTRMIAVRFAPFVHALGLVGRQKPPDKIMLHRSMIRYRSLDRLIIVYLLKRRAVKHVTLREGLKSSFIRRKRNKITNNKM
ncbi:MAG: hypothetical protein ACXWKW_05085, partial [Asticcacaulis sp.]